MKRQNICLRESVQEALRIVELTERENNKIAHKLRAYYDPKKPDEDNEPDDLVFRGNAADVVNLTAHALLQAVIEAETAKDELYVLRAAGLIKHNSRLGDIVADLSPPDSEQARCSRYFQELMLLGYRFNVETSSYVPGSLKTGDDEPTPPAKPKRKPKPGIA